MSVPTIGRLTAAIVFFLLIPDALASQPLGTDLVPTASESRAVTGLVAHWLADPDPGFTLTRPPCTEGTGQGPGERKWPRFLGWLYRWARGYDLERSRTPAPNLYLRSPLLSGFDEQSGCAVPDPTPRVTCVELRTSDGHEHMATYLMSLPQMGARTPEELAGRLRKQLAKGKLVALRLLGGGQTDLDPKLALKIEVRACQSEIGD